MIQTKRSIPASILIALAMALLLVPCASAQINRPPSNPPQEIRGVDLVQRPGNQLPLATLLKDQDGKPVRLGDYFDGEQPVALLFVYYSCPLICPQTINSVHEAFNKIDGWIAGDDYRLLVVSFDHRDGPAASKLQRDKFLRGFNHEPLDKGTDFLTGDPQEIRKIASEAGFYYRFHPDVGVDGEYYHPSALIFVRPDGKVHNYLNGVKYDPQDVRLGLIEAGKGRGATLFEQALLLCYAPDAHTGKYVIQPMRVMQIVGGLSILLLGGLIGGLMLSNRIARQRLLARASTNHDRTNSRTPSSPKVRHGTHLPHAPPG